MIEGYRLYNIEGFRGYIYKDSLDQGPREDYTARG